MIDATAWVETGEWLATAPDTSAKAFAADALKARLHKVAKRGKRLRKADDMARHHLRIEAKKLRYAAEAFASLYPQKPMGRFIGKVKDLQESAGRPQRPRRGRAAHRGIAAGAAGRLRRRRAPGPEARPEGPPHRRGGQGGPSPRRGGRALRLSGA